MKPSAVKCVKDSSDFWHHSIMKKYFSFAVAALAVSMLLASCTMHTACSAYSDAEVVSEK